MYDRMKKTNRKTSNVLALFLDRTEP